MFFNGWGASSMTGVCLMTEKVIELREFRRGLVRTFGQERGFVPVQLGENGAWVVVDLSPDETDAPMRVYTLPEHLATEEIATKAANYLNHDREVVGQYDIAGAEVFRREQLQLFPELMELIAHWWAIGEMTLEGFDANVARTKRAAA